MSRSLVPLGVKYCFDPKDHELMVYLSCKANGEQLPCDDFIIEIDLYHIVDLKKLFTSKEDILYAFTKVKKMSKNGKNVNRKVSENRFWKGLDKQQPIYNEAGCLVGQKRKYSFMNNRKMNLGYHMTEFVLDKKSLKEAKFKDYVVCRIKRNVKKVGGSIEIHGEQDFGFQENSLSTVLALTTPSDSTAIAASSNAASNSPINNAKKDSAGLSNPPQNCCSQYDGEQINSNEYYAPPELHEDVDVSRIQDMTNVCSRLFYPPQNVFYKFL